MLGVLEYVHKRVAKLGGFWAENTETDYLLLDVEQIV